MIIEVVLKLILGVFMNGIFSAEFQQLKGVNSVNVKPGFKTTEFWLYVLSTLYFVIEGIMYYFQHVDPNAPVSFGIAGLAITYGLQRAYVKGRLPIINQVIDKIAPGVSAFVESAAAQATIPVPQTPVQATTTTTTPTATASTTQAPTDFSNVPPIPPFVSNQQGA